MNIIQIPAFKDNYIWILHELNSKHAVVVDPGESEQVIKYLNDNNLVLSDKGVNTTSEWLQSIYPHVIRIIYQSIILNLIDS